MVFRYYSNALSQASRAVASAILTVGLVLIGFGVVIAAFPEVFAYLAAAVFFLVGIGCAMTAGKILWTQHRLHRMPNDEPQIYRHNVRIHTQDHYDL